MSIFRLIILSGVLLFSAPNAFAQGSGATGGALSGRTGSVEFSKPSFNPAEEYRSGIEFFQAAEYKKADKAFGRVLSVSPKHAETNYLMGLTQAGLEKDKKAARFFKKAVRYRPNLYDAYGQLAAAYMRTDKTEKAQAVLADLREIEAECAGTCRRVGQIETALATVETAIAEKGQIQTAQLLTQ